MSPTPLLAGVLQRVRVLRHGVALALLIALAATFIAEHYGGPQLLYALFFGLAFHFLFQDARCQPGIEFCTKTLLRAGVALLGVRITFAQIGQLGIGPLVTAVLGIVSTIVLGAWLARRLGLKTDLGLLCGAAVSICGASAALAVSAVMPRTEEREQQTLLTVVGVTALSTLAMVFYPVLVRLLHFSDVGAGIFLGGTIHDVAQVIGAGMMISHPSADVAVVVKLFRVGLLVPVVAVLAYWWRRQAGRQVDGVADGAAGEVPDRAPLLPMFLLGFVLLMLVNSAGYITLGVSDALGQLSRLCLVLAIAALGVKTSFEELVKLGWRPLALMVAETLWLATLFAAYVLLSEA